MKPKVSTGYLTPQPHKKIRTKKKSNSSENLYAGLEITDEAFKELLSDPIKRNLILSIITSEKDKIEAYKQTLKNKKTSSPIKKVLQIPYESPSALLKKRALKQQNTSSPIKKVLQIPYESPSALLRRRALEKQKNAQLFGNNSQNRCDIRSVFRQSMTSTMSSPVMINQILKNVIAFVEVKSGSTDRSNAVKAQLTLMGATVRETFTRDVTHVVFKEGSFNTYQKSNLLKAHLVSVLWLNACKCAGIKLPEKEYPAISIDNDDHDASFMCLQMQNEYEELLREKSSIPSDKPSLSETARNDNRDTMMTPNSKKAAPFAKMYEIKENKSDELSFSDNSDVVPIINGDLEANSECFSNTSNSNESINFIEPIEDNLINRPKDIMQGQIIFAEKESNLPNTSINIYNVKTPKIGVSTEPLDTNVHLKQSELFDNTLLIEETSQTDLNIKNSFDKTNISKSDNSDVSYQSEITRNKEKTIFSEIRHDNTDKTYHIPLETVHESAEKSSSTNMSSLRMSKNSNENISGNLNSSFSSFQPIINNILETLETSDESGETNENTNQNNRNSFASDENFTPKTKIKNTYHEHVTLRKKCVEPKTFNIKENNFDDISFQEHVTKSLLLATPELTDDDSYTDEEIECTKNPPNVIKKVDPLNDNNIKTNEIKPTLWELLEKSMIRQSQFEQLCNETQTEDGKLSKVREPVVRNLNMEFEMSDKNQVTSKRTTNVPFVHSKKNQESKELKINTDLNKGIISKTVIDRGVFLDCNKETHNENFCLRRKSKADLNIKLNSVSDSLIQSKNNDNHSAKKKLKTSDKEDTSTKSLNLTDSSMEEAYTSNCSEEAQKNNSKKEKSANLSKQLGSASGGSKQLEKNAKKKPTTSYKKHIEEKKTFACSEMTNSDTEKDTSIISLNSIEEPTSQPNSDEKKKRKVRRLYSPSDIPGLLISDEEERREKRLAAQNKKREEEGIVPIIFSEKVKEILKLNNVLTQNNKMTKEFEKSSLVERRTNNSDNDEQVQLKDVILNQEKHEKDQGEKKMTEPFIFKTPTNTVSRHSLKKLTKGPTNPKEMKSLSVNLTRVNFKPVTTVQSRRSTLEFQSNIENIKSRLKFSRFRKPSIVCTKMHSKEVETFTNIVRKLGKFEVEDEVSCKTTHLVVGEPKRTVNMLKAIARGCWILKKEWLFSSLEKNRWLPEEDFEEIEFSPAVQKNRLFRQAFGSKYTMDIFEDCGSMYVARGSAPKCSVLRELIHLCKGKTTRLSSFASIIIGEYSKSTNATCVSELWILDSIIENRKLPYTKYMLPHNRRIV